jgi:hypothetical protein
VGNLKTSLPLDSLITLIEGTQDYWCFLLVISLPSECLRPEAKG